MYYIIIEYIVAVIYISSLIFIFPGINRVFKWQGQLSENLFTIFHRSIYLSLINSLEFTDDVSENVIFDFASTKVDKFNLLENGVKYILFY